MDEQNGLSTLLACGRLVDSDPNLFFATLKKISHYEWLFAVRITVRAFVIHYNQLLAAYYEPTPVRKRPTEAQLAASAETYEYWSRMPNFAEMTVGLRMNYINKFHGLLRLQE